MPLRIMQPAQPAVSYQGGGNNRNQVQMAFGNQMSAADRKALNLREEELAFQKDLADRKFAYETKNADRTYDETVRSNKEQEAFRRQEITNTKSYYEQQSPQNQAKARLYEEDQLYKAGLTRIANKLELPEDQRTEAAVARAAWQQAQLEAQYQFELKDNMLKRGAFTDQEQMLAQAAELGILPEGPPAGTPGSEFSILNPPATIYDAQTPEEARALADRMAPDPTDGTTLEGIGGQKFLRMFADAENRAHMRKTGEIQMKTGVEAARRELKVIADSAQPIQNMLNSLEQAHVEYFEMAQQLSTVKQVAEATQKTIQTYYPTVIKTRLDDYLKADIKPSTEAVVTDILSKLPGEGSAWHRVLQNPDLLEDTEFLSDDNWSLLGIRGNATATKLAIDREEARLMRENPKKHSLVAPIISELRNRVAKIETIGAARMAAHEPSSRFINLGTKIKLFDANVRRLYETGNTSGAIDPDFAREVIQLENAGDPTAETRLLGAASEQGATYNPAFSDTLPQSFDDTPLGQELDRFHAGGDPDAISPEALAKAGFSGQFPWDVNKWLFDQIGYLPTDSRKEFYDSGYYRRVLDRLQKRHEEIQKRQAEMQARKAQLDVTKYRPEGVQLKPAPARKTQGGDRPRMKPTQQTKQGYAGGS